METFINLQNNDRQWSLSETVSQDGRSLIKVPIAFVGEWKHPQYGQVKFSEDDLTTMETNWKQARGGYDPPLFLGHPMNNDVLEGDPSEGWPENIYREGDTLYGEYMPTSEELIEDVRKKRFRYASAEVIHDAVDKSTGEKIGPLLVGLALTNRPFLPMKERTLEIVTKFSDSSGDQLPCIFSFDLRNNQEATMTTATVNQEVAGTSPQPTGAENSTPSSQQVFSQPKQTSAAEDFVSKTDYQTLQNKYSELAEQFSSLAAEHSATKTVLSDLLEREKSKAVEEKLSKLEKLNLPKERKDLFSDMIKNGELSETAEAKLFSDFQNESEKYGHLFTATQGDVNESTVNTNKIEMPQVYSDMIERNRQIIEQRRQRL